MANQPRCPGQDMRFWKPEDISHVRCPHCRTELEFFTDEPVLRCRSCGNEVRKAKVELGCAKWCAFAEECLGVVPEKPDEVKSLCERVILEMKATFGTDQRRIDHALGVLHHVETILETETADPLTVKAAAILHDIGIQEAERKHGSAAARWQELEGPPIARPILEKLGVDQQRIDHVCRIVGSHHSARDIDTPEFRIVWDADWLVNSAEELAGMSREQRAILAARMLRTRKGRQLAEAIKDVSSQE